MVPATRTRARFAPYGGFLRRQTTRTPILNILLNLLNKFICSKSPFLPVRSPLPSILYIETVNKHTVKEETLYRYIKGEITPDEELQVAAWLEEDRAAHTKKLNEVRFIYQFTLMHEEKLSERFEAENTPVSRPRVARQPLSVRRIGGYALRIAAVIMLMIGGGYVTKQSMYKKYTEQTTILQVPNGQRIQITLSDGSNIWLNSGARLEYPVIFKDNLRRVKLSGEAMFEVQPDSERPFEVETFATDIRVLGTKFNVVADEQHGRFTTTLLQGKVKISNRLNSRQQEIIMLPDDVVNLSNGRLFKETVKDSEALCWTEGLVNITGLPFDELMSKFEQVFDVRIVITCETLPDIGRISGKIRVNDGIDNALHILQYAADFTYEKNAETNVVTIY